MSEAERETELVQGTIQGITAKGSGKWTVQVQPDESQYTKNLWTSDAELKDALEPLIGQHRAFVCRVSHWQMQDGKNVRSLWINSSLSEAPAQAPVSAPQTPSKGTPAREYTPDTKDRMIVRQTALKAAAEIVAPRAGTSIDPDYDAALEVMKAASRFERWVYRDIDEVPSEAAAPPLSEHDESIGYPE